YWAQWYASQSGCNGPGAAVGQSGGRARSLRGHPRAIRAGRWARARDHLQAGGWAGRRRCSEFGAPLLWACRGAQRARNGLAVLDAHTGRGVCGDTGPIAQRTDERLALVPNAGVPSVGPEWILSIGGRLRLPRSTARFDGTHSQRAATRPQASPTLCRETVSGRRCPALVASPFRQGRAYALFGRLPLATTGDMPLCA